jgi:hypothetical protein
LQSHVSTGNAQQPLLGSRVGLPHTSSRTAGGRWPRSAGRPWRRPETHTPASVQWATAHPEAQPLPAMVLKNSSPAVLQLTGRQLQHRSNLEQPGGLCCRVLSRWVGQVPAYLLSPHRQVCQAVPSVLHSMPQAVLPLCQVLQAPAPQPRMARQVAAETEAAVLDEE